MSQRTGQELIGEQISLFPSVDIRPVSHAVGAEILGVDVSDCSDEAFDSIRSAWQKFSAILVRAQSLTDDDLIRFSRRFGELDHAPVMENGRTAVDGKPEIYVISNVVGSDGKAIGSLGSGEAVWHTDMSYLPRPPDASLLYSIEVPAVGGDTWLAGMNAACDCLPDELREAVKGRSIKHDGTYNSGGFQRQGVRTDDDPRTSEGRAHPIICEHPETGTPTLYLGRRRNAYVVGLELDESEALLDKLWAHATRPEFAYRHKWAVGDLLMWDNRCTLHRRDEFDPALNRVMHRTQVKGNAIPTRAQTG